MANTGVDLPYFDKCCTKRVRFVRVLGVCSGLCGVRFLPLCSGKSGGKLVNKSARKLVGCWWKDFTQAVDNRVLNSLVEEKWSFARGGVKVLQEFCTAVFPCFDGVLHSFHIAYYNYY